MIDVQHTQRDARVVVLEGELTSDLAGQGPSGLQGGLDPPQGAAAFSSRTTAQCLAAGSPLRRLGEASV